MEHRFRMDGGGGDEPEMQRCPHCRGRFLPTVLATHIPQCEDNKPRKSVGAKCVPPPHVLAASLLEGAFDELRVAPSRSVDDRGGSLPPPKCSHCREVIPRKELASHEKQCKLNLDARVEFLFDCVVKAELKEQQIESDLEVLIERKRKEISIAVLGQKKSGRTSVKDQLLTRYYSFIDPSEAAGISEEFIKEVSMADSVILVFDRCIIPEDGGSSSAILAYHLGIKDIICCFNKMDRAADSSMLYQKLRASVFHCLQEIGFDVDGIPCVPISALSGDNISRRSANFDAWYEGPTVLEALNQKVYPSKKQNLLRLVVHGVDDEGLVCGRIHSGTLQVGQTVTFCPGAWSTDVEQVVISTGGSVQEAYPGEVVNMKLKDPLDQNVVKRGAVGSREPVGEAGALTTRLFMFHGRRTLKVDAVAYISCCHVAEVGTYVSIVERTGADLAIIDQSLRPGDTGVVGLTLDKPVAVEVITDYPTLARVILLNRRRSVLAYGVVTDMERRYRSPPAEPEPLQGPSTKKDKKKKKKKKKGGRGRH